MSRRPLILILCLAAAVAALARADWRDDSAGVHDVFRLPDSGLFLPDGSDGAVFAFGTTNAGRVTMYVTAQTPRPDRLIVEVDSGSGLRRVASRFGLRDRALDLTAALGGPGQHQLRLRSAAGAAITVSALVIRQIPESSAPPVGVLVLIAAVLLAGAAWPRRGLDVTSAALLVGAAAFALRWHTLLPWRGLPLQGDATFYRQIADGFQWRHPFDTGMREPMMIWLDRVVTAMGGGPFADRLMSAVFSSATAGLVVALGWILFDELAAGVAAGLLFAAGDFYVWNAVRGERTEMYVALMSLYLVVLLWSRRTGLRRWDAALGVLGGVLGLTWLIGALGAALAYPLRLVTLERRRERLSLFFGTMLLLLLPHFAAQKRMNGDPFFALNAHANFYRSAETTGTPSYAGGKGSLGGLMTERPLHRAAGLLRGYVDVFIDPRAAFNRIFLGFHYTDSRAMALYPLLLLGLVAAAMRLQAAAFWSALAFLNVAPAMAEVVRDPRLFLFAGVFVALFFGNGAALVIDRVVRLRSKRSP